MGKAKCTSIILDSGTERHVIFDRNLLKYATNHRSCNVRIKGVSNHCLHAYLVVDIGCFLDCLVVANASMKLKKKMGDTPMTSASCSKLEMPLVIASATATHMIALLGPSIDGPPPQQPHTCIDAPTVPRIPATT